MMVFFLFLFVVACIIICTSTLIFTSSRGQEELKLPPGPKQFPIIGNIFSLGPKPHQSLAKLANKYGPIITLKLGTITTIVVSSPEIAKLVLQKHDLELSDRTIPNAVKSIGHDQFSMAWLPVGNHWRKLRKISKEHMFSVPRLDASKEFRREKMQKLSDHVRESLDAGRAVAIGEVIFETSLNLLSTSIFSADFTDCYPALAKEMKDVIEGMLKCFGIPNLADYFPALQWVDPQGITRDTKVYVQKMFDFFDMIIDEKIKSKREKGDMLDVMVELNQRQVAELSRDDIKYLLLDLYLAGTDTVAVTVEWAMTELLRNPDKLSTIQDEMMHFDEKQGEKYDETDILCLPYLQAVVKETLRLHPPLPFLVPRKASTQVEIDGYTIPKDAQIFVNVWASGKDSSIWLDPDSFMPERFLDGEKDRTEFKGNHFELIPFGAGRRICPGLPLAHRMVHLMLATLVGEFDWKLDGGMKPEEIDMSEKFGFTLQKAEALKAIPVKLGNR